MIETKPLNHNWSHFAILLGLTLHQFKKKLLLKELKVYNSLVKVGKVLLLKSDKIF